MIRKKLGNMSILCLLWLAASAGLAAGVTSVIVELEGDPAAVYAAKAKQSGNGLSEEQLQAYRGQLRAAQDRFLQDLQTLGVSAQVRSIEVADSAGNSVNVEFRYTLVFNGVNLLVEQADAAAIGELPQVKAVHRDHVFVPGLDRSVEYTRAPEVYGGVPELGPFDDLREGFEGQGIRLSVIDTGVDWPHEMFGLDPSPPRLGVEPVTALTSATKNKKVIYYLPLGDLVVEDGFGHGTHVASTAAGYLGFSPGNDSLPLTDDDVPLHGVAPQARVMAYKVCSDSLSTVGALTGAIGGCLTSSIVLGIEDSVSPRTVNGLPKPVAHVINMSLGGAGGPDSPTAVASDNASLLGAIVVSSAGNSGPGEGTVGAPAAGQRVIAVAASTDPGGGGWSADVLDSSSVDPAMTGAVTPAGGLPSAAAERQNIRLFPMSGTPSPPPGSMAQYYVLVRNGQLLSEWPASVNGRIALVRLTDPLLPASPFAQIANNGAAAGAAAVLLESATQNPTAIAAPIPSANVSPGDAQYLVGLMGAGAAPPNGTISQHPIRLNPRFGVTFTGQMAGFSSRGPVQGFGQVKPDVTAPGVNVLAAVPPASVLGALGATSGGLNYASVSGTSMASPHTAGAAALLKQAHPSWDPDMVRTVLINTATNLRDEQGAPKAEGLDSILDQGGGLIDVFEAVNAAALMGVPGDGINRPSILGSHSFGEVPVINCRCLHSESVDVVIRDVSGAGGSYDLSVANNRNADLSGVDVILSSTSLAVPANGSAGFTVDASFNGDLIREGSALQLMWYVLANRSDGGETLRMPFYYRATESEPGVLESEAEVFAGTLAAGDANLGTAPGVTFSDTAFEVGAATLKIDALLEFDEIVDDLVADLDFLLFDPDGNQIGSSLTPGGPERITVNVNRAGTYTYRVTGFLNTPTDFTITSTQVLGQVGPPTLLPVAGESVDPQGRQVDFDGDFTVAWQPLGGESGFEVERSVDGGDWLFVAGLGPDTTSLRLSDQPAGEQSFRVRSLFPGEICSFVTDPSNVETILVDRLAEATITRDVKQTVSSVSFADGVFTSLVAQKPHGLAPVQSRSNDRGGTRSSLRP